MTTNSTQKSGGIGFLSLLALLFIGLKLANAIHWSWVWVLSPLWFPFAVIAVLGLIYLALSGAGALLRNRQHNRISKQQRSRIVSDLDRRS